MAGARVARRRDREARSCSRDTSGAINSVEFSPDGARVLSASEDGTARIWRADGTGEPIVLPHARYASFTPDGARVIAFPNTPDGDVVLRIFRADGAGEPVVLRHEGSFLEDGWDVSPDGALVVAGAREGVGLWRLDGTLIGFRGGTWGDAHFSSDGSRILSTSDTCRVWRSDLRSPSISARGIGWEHSTAAPSHRMDAASSMGMDAASPWRWPTEAHLPSS